MSTDENDSIVQQGQQFDHSGWWYISFADDQGFLGGAIVLGDGLEDAVREAWRRGVNPGGQAMCVPVFIEPPAEFTNRRLTREDIERMDEVLGA